MFALFFKDIRFESINQQGNILTDLNRKSNGIQNNFLTALRLIAMFWSNQDLTLGVNES